MAGDSQNGAFSDAFDVLPSMLAIIDVNGKVTHWNQAAALLTSKKTSEALSRSIWELVPFLKDHERKCAKVIETGRAETLRRVMSTSSGDEKALNISFYPLNGRGAVVQVEDVTVEMKKDEHLRQAQKMDSVGNLAAGLAHDFNNVIGGIQATLSSIEFSLQMTKDPAKFKQELTSDLEVIKEATENGAGMVEQLLSISRRKELEFSTVDLNDLVRKVIGICERTFGKMIEIKTSFAKNEALMEAYPTQLNQVLLNICVNASHAMTFMRPEGERHGGVLNVSVEMIAVGENMTSMFPDAEVGNYWLISISDTGIGMSKDTLAKIFEPFYTTKDKGKGTGLGLSMVYNIVRQHHGFLEVFSEVGVGTTFLVFLPVSPNQKEDDRDS